MSGWLVLYDTEIATEVDHFDALDDALAQERELDAQNNEDRRRDGSLHPLSFIVRDEDARRVTRMLDEVRGKL